MKVPSEVRKFFQMRIIVIEVGKYHWFRLQSTFPTSAPIFQFYFELSKLSIFPTAQEIALRLISFQLIMWNSTNWASWIRLSFIEIKNPRIPGIHPKILVSDSSSFVGALSPSIFIILFLVDFKISIIERRLENRLLP